MRAGSTACRPWWWGKGLIPGGQPAGVFEAALRGMALGPGLRRDDESKGVSGRKIRETRG